ncbi:hypothetical protein [Dyella sp.]|uniref:hypothetical protein n=1 Tax=Dyella sp. TaxID=1869338 RepID=UPI002D794A52|nr:hypothetical protein [Dyella sp.]HET7333379.1 hypothetical protein [Dyella sp.]
MLKKKSRHVNWDAVHIRLIIVCRDLHATLSGAVPFFTRFPSLCRVWLSANRSSVAIAAFHQAAASFSESLPALPRRRQCAPHSYFKEEVYQSTASLLQPEIALQRGALKQSCPNLFEISSKHARCDAGCRRRDGFMKVGMPM